MWSQLWPYCRRNSVWMCSDDTLTAIDQAATSFNWPESMYIAEGYQGQPFPTLKGRPLIVVEQCPVLGATGDLLVGDWTQYLLCIRKTEEAQTDAAMEIAFGRPEMTIENTSSEHKRFDTDEVVRKWKFRVDGKPMWPTTVTIADGSQKNGPFVSLHA